MRIYKRPAPEKLVASLDFLPATGAVTITLVSVTAKNLATGVDATAAIIAADPAPVVLPGTQKVAFAVQGGILGEHYSIEITVTVADGQEYKDYAFLEIIAENFELFRKLVADRIQDGATKLAQPAIDACIVKALRGRYAQARPLVRIKDFAGDGLVFEYAVDATAFPDWVDGASFIGRIEYPAGEKTPVYLDGDDWLYPVRISSTVKKLRLLTTIPQTGKTLRIQYSVPQKTDASTIPAADLEGAADLAASYACVELAAAYNQLVDPMFGAPTDAAHQTKSQHYLTLAKKYEGQFEAAFGLDAEVKQPPATAWREWPAQGGGGESAMTH